MTATETIPGVQSQTITLPIMGMSCAACSSYLEQTLTSLPGVSSASVSLLANKATITSSSLPAQALIFCDPGLGLRCFSA